VAVIFASSRYSPLMLAVFVFILAAQSPDPFTLDATGAQQAVVVTTETWADKVGVLKRYDRVDGKWVQKGEAIEVVVGDSGLGWGLGLHPLGVGEPRKTEGDGRAPAGVFRLVSAFGRGAPAVATKMPWLEVKENLGCVDDPASKAYNRILDVTAGAPDWKSFEKLMRNDPLYDTAVIVDHNSLGTTDVTPIAGRGSCIFLHVWRKKGRGTDGCTAMARGDLDKTLEWLDPAKKPVLIQLPKTETVKRRAAWGLP
jgi:L,D-peptidoglycan transpeptidase YkuD (ErfK/YbiS/YcfS/YnhG family)